MFLNGTLARTCSELSSGFRSELAIRTADNSFPKQPFAAVVQRQLGEDSSPMGFDTASTHLGHADHRRHLPKAVIRCSASIVPTM